MLQQKWILQDTLIRVILLIDEKVYRLLKRCINFLRQCAVFLEVENDLVVRAFVCRRTNRDRSHSWLQLVWNVMRAAVVNKNRASFFNFVLLYFQDLFLLIPSIKQIWWKNKRGALTSTDRTPLFHKGDGRNVHVQTKGCMFVMWFISRLLLYHRIIITATKLSHFHNFVT